MLEAIIILAGCSPATAPPTLTLAPTPRPSPTPTSIPCTVLHNPATPAALGAEFGVHGHITGPADAPVTIVVFSDFQCPACAFLAASLKLIRQTHPTDVRLIFVNTPNASLDKDSLATQAVEAADQSGKFWEMHDLLFSTQGEWLSLSPADFKSWLVTQALTLGIAAVKFQADFDSTTVKDKVNEIVQSASSQNIVPPVLFINSDARYNGLADFASLDSVVRLDALTPRQFSDCPAWIIDPLKQYVATLHTSKGDIAIQLLPDKAPYAVDAFVELASKGWYNGVTFFKVIPGLLAMTGDPSETGMGNPGYLFNTEIMANQDFKSAGIVAMDNSGPNTNGSRFFITLAAAPQLNGQFTIFGNVIGGLDVLNALTPRNPTPGTYQVAGDELISVTIQVH